MNSGRVITILLWCYAAFVFAFIFAPIVVSFIVSFNSDRFPTLPLGEFTTKWYQDIWGDPTLWPALQRTVIVGVCVALISTLLGFGAAYTDYRYRFFGKNFYLALALLPPTIPVVILGLAMLVFLSQVGLFGQLHSVILSHVVLCTPFAMALIRLRLSQMDESLEAAAWNLGASEWRAMREVILPFTLPAILSALFITMAVSFDEFAIEEALRVKEAKGGEVVLVSLGPDRVLTALRSGLAMGADSAIHLKDPLFERADPLATAQALAAAIRPLDAELILTGQQGVGGDNSQVPGLLAEILDLPQVTMAVKLDVQDGKAVVTRETEGAHEEWEVFSRMRIDQGAPLRDYYPLTEATRREYELWRANGAGTEAR